MTPRLHFFLMDLDIEDSVIEEVIRNYLQNLLNAKFSTFDAALKQYNAVGTISSYTGNELSSRAKITLNTSQALSDVGTLLELLRKDVRVEKAVIGSLLLYTPTRIHTVRKNGCSVILSVEAYKLSKTCDALHRMMVGHHVIGNSRHYKLSCTIASKAFPEQQLEILDISNKKISYLP